MPYTDFHYTPTGTGVISGKEVLEQTEDAINDLGGQISGDVQTAIDTANNALNTANTASADAQNAVNTANTAHTAATNAQNTANAAQNTASNALTAAQNAQNDVNALGNRVTTAENNISQNTSDISGLTTRMGTAEGNITTLQNDVITAQGTATSAQNTATMARQQAYVLRYSSTAITDNSTIAYSTLDNTDNIKADDKIIDVDGKIFSVVSVDSDNSTVTVGSALIDLALDGNVLHRSGNETVAGNKTFSGNTKFTSVATIEKSSGDVELLIKNSAVNATSVSANAVDDIRFVDSNDRITGSVRIAYDTSNGVTVMMYARSYSADGSVSVTNGISITSNQQTGAARASVSANLLPNVTDTYTVGSSTVQWKDCYTKAINGINPGALSLPDLDNGLDISGYITDLTGASNINKYTPVVNGWISVGLSNAEFIELYIPSALMGGTFTKTSTNTYAQAFMPVIANKEVRISLKGTSIGWAKFYPCLGNV